MLYLINATLYTPEHTVRRAAVLVMQGRIAAVGPMPLPLPPPGAAVLDAEGLLLVPGLIDLQCNGAFGDDFTAAPQTIWRVAAALPRYGITSFLPTIISAPLSTVVAAQEVMQQGPPSGFGGAAPLGLHLEGPFLNPLKRGAHDLAWLQLPSLAAAATWHPAGGVRLVSLAPELPGAAELVSLLAGRGVLVSAAHSQASYQQALAGFDAGIRYGTHLFNAMPPLHHRHPGLAGALLADARPVVGLIADGLHVHPALVALAWRTLGPQRLNLVSDAMAALGQGPGRYVLGDSPVQVSNDSDARLADGTLAGSVLALDQALRNLLAWTGCTLNEALASVTTTPAAALGLGYERGRIAPGYVADLVLLTPDLHVHTVLAEGQVVYARSDLLRPL
ncbi:MAG: N-acetylglucosamine-6-phosphate deacetylase [Caldilineales bacterium]